MEVHLKINLLSRTFSMYIISTMTGKCFVTIDIERKQNRLLKVCYVPATSVASSEAFSLMHSITVLMRQTRQAVCAINQSTFLRCLCLLLRATYKW